MAIANRSYYQILETLKTQLQGIEGLRTVTTGDISEIDLSKQTMFSLAHIVVNNVSLQEQSMTYSVSIIFMDLVADNKEEPSDEFRGNTNEQDVLNSMLHCANVLTSKLRSGTLYRDKYQLEGDVSCEPFYERYENELTGWAVSFSVIIPNDVYQCS